jgi:hypothetical protein
MNAVIALVNAKVPHLAITVLLAVVVSGVVALLDNRSGRERLYHAAYCLAGCVASVVAGSWIMYLVHG